MISFLQEKDKLKRGMLETRIVLVIKMVADIRI